VASSALWTDLRDQGRATVGAFVVVGISYLYTMEAWWLAWQLDTTHLLVFTVAGIAIVLELARTIGFHKQNESDGSRDEGSSGDGDSVGDGESSGDWRLGSAVYDTVTDATEAIVQSFVAAYVVLFLFGVLTFDDSPVTAARLGIFHVVPLGFGAALANDLFAGSGGEQPSRKFAESVGVFALGAIFLSAPIALTQEMELIVTYTEWSRLAGLLVATLLATHLTLFELELQGQDRRVRHRSKLLQVGHTFTVYAVGVVVAVALLAAFGHFDGQPVSVWVQETVVLAFPTSVGASAAQVVL
jgi:uncharacterized membrane protein